MPTFGTFGTVKVTVYGLQCEWLPSYAIIDNVISDTQGYAQLIKKQQAKILKLKILS